MTNPTPAARLMPAEPTPAMLDAAVAFALNVSISGDYNWSAYMSDVWKTMLAAAPAAQPPLDATMQASEQDAIDAARYRWLRHRVSAHGIIDGWAFGFPTHLSLPASAEAMLDPAAALDISIDAAIAKGKAP